MKKSLYFGIVTFIVAMSFAFIGCSDNDDDTEPDKTIPTLTDDSVVSTTTSGATVTFTSNEAGTYFLKVLEESEDEPTAAEIKSGKDYTGTVEAATAKEIPLSDLDVDTNYIAYIIVEDAAGNQSKILKIDFTTIATYTVTFNTGDGGSSVASINNVAHGATITAPTGTPTRGNYTFTGKWYKEPALTNEWVFATETVTANTTLYAKWNDTRVVLKAAETQGNNEVNADVLTAKAKFYSEAAIPAGSAITASDFTVPTGGTISISTTTAPVIESDNKTVTVTVVIAAKNNTTGPRTFNVGIASDSLNVTTAASPAVLTVTVTQKKDAVDPGLPTEKTLSIAADSTTDSGFTVKWTEAPDDDVTTAANLKYFVYVKEESTFGGTDAADIKADNGAVLKTGTTGVSYDPNGFEVTGLKANTDYYYAVIVADEAGNESAYTVSTEAETTEKATIEWVNTLSGNSTTSKVSGTVIARLSSGTFAAGAAATTYTSGYTVTNPPAGIVADTLFTAVRSEDGSTITFTASGSVTATATTAVNNLTITFEDAAFTSPNDVASKTKVDLAIEFTAGA
ncbi:MAG: InlB B-repeat-containing protein [Treponema sp.]|jgi:uncharacterized repeat protein (TIGR02543 family)|nr:InlB B-repeat-containing protein [Treponema sp.]